jgi:hypothetical protein
MQIAPTIRLIDTRFDILFSPILKNRSQGMLDRFLRSSARNAHDDLFAGLGRKPATSWSRSTLPGR